MEAPVRQFSPDSLVFELPNYTDIVTICLPFPHAHTNPTPIQMPLLVPSLTYSFDTMVECTDDLGRTEAVHVYIVKPGNPVPLITAILSMPISENIIVT